MDRTAEAILEFTTRFRYEDLSDTAVAAAKRRLIDTIGCALGGYISPPAHAARRVAYPVGGPLGARIWGSMLRTTPDAAAFANGVAVRYLDFNDSYRGAADGGHASDNLPALIACAEERHASGRDFLAGMAVCYEIHLRMNDTVPFNNKGWDQPTAGVMAAAMGVGKILGLSRTQLAHALSLAVVPNVTLHQTRSGELSWWKGAAGPLGGARGLFAAQLAEAGMEGPHDPIEGENGLFTQIGGAYELKPLGAGPRLALEQSNLKTWPVRDSCQLAVEAARMLRQQVRAEEIASLHVRTYQSTYRWAVRDPELWAPKTRETADHSMPFAIAATLLDGEVSPDTFRRQRFLDPDVLGLIGNMRIEVNPEFTAQTPGVRNCLIEATLKSGESQRAHYVLTQKQIEQGIPDEVVIDKFNRLAGDLLLDGQRERLLDLIWRIEKVEDMAQVVDLLHV